MYNSVLRFWQFCVWTQSLKKLFFRNKLFIFKDYILPLIVKMGHLSYGLFGLLTICTKREIFRPLSFLFVRHQAKTPVCGQTLLWNNNFFNDSFFWINMYYLQEWAELRNLGKVSSSKNPNFFQRSKITLNTQLIHHSRNCETSVTWRLWTFF